MSGINTPIHNPDAWPGAAGIQLPFLRGGCGGRDDPSVLLVMGSTPGGSYLVWSHQWLHRDGYIKRREHVPYAEFESSGELTVFDEPDADITAITKQIIKLSPANTAVDPYGLKTLVEILEGRGHTATGIPQGWKLSPHIDYTERLIYAGRIIHHGGPMLRWNIGNARAEDRHGARSITKPSGASVDPERNDIGRTDALQATVGPVRLDARRQPVGSVKQ